jgi:hypothetical protein
MLHAERCADLACYCADMAAAALEQIAKIGILKAIPAGSTTGSVECPVCLDVTCNMVSICWLPDSTAALNASSRASFAEFRAEVLIGLRRFLRWYLGDVTGDELCGHSARVP